MHTIMKNGTRPVNIRRKRAETQRKDSEKKSNPETMYLQRKTRNY